LELLALLGLGEVFGNDARGDHVRTALVEGTARHTAASRSPTIRSVL
jgi:hypothetical protein